MNAAPDSRARNIAARIANVPGMMRRILAFAAVGLGLQLPLVIEAEETEAEIAARVIVLANSDDADSVRLARLYAERRAIPFDNIVALKMPLTETISWRQFVTSVHEPLQAELLQRGWIDGISMNVQDEVGRRRVVVSGHRIAYLVTCRGVPLRIAHDPALVREVPPFTSRSELRTNAAAVDAELSLLAWSGSPINAFVPNPFFDTESPLQFPSAQVIKVSRLDGPSFEHARSLVESALTAERTGLIGRAYVDLGGPHPDGDRWLEDVAGQVEALGFDLEVDREGGTFGEGRRADAAVLYFGWYAPQLNGPFALPGYRFAPGAIALHIHSFSAASMRQEQGGGWTGPLVARGVAATFGNVAEPYLQFTHRPDLVLNALARGARLGDAAYEALPYLSWQGIVVGDPLYRPFKLSLADQAARRSQLSDTSAAHLLLRELNLMDASGEAAEARRRAREGLRSVTAAALWLEVARREAKAGEGTAVARRSSQVSGLRPSGASEWGLHAAVARQLFDLGATEAAVSVWTRLLQESQLPALLRSTWLPEAAQAARIAGDEEQAGQWEREMAGASAR